MRAKITMKLVYEYEVKEPLYEEGTEGEDCVKYDVGFYRENPDAFMEMDNKIEIDYEIIDNTTA